MNDEQRPDDSDHSSDRSTDPLESEMSREFDKRVRDLHEAPLSFETVRGKAMTIQRNRRIAVAGGLLAAAAVIVPVAVLAGTDLGTSDEIPPATSTPSPSRATDPNDPTPSEPTTSALGVDYLEGRTWHRTDGSDVTLDRRYDGGTTVGDELLAVRNSNGGLTIDVVDADGTVSESIATWSYPIADAEHTVAAYIEPGGSVALRSEGAGTGYSAGLVDGDSIVAVTGDDCAAGPGVSCRVFVSHGDGSPPEVLSSEGTREVAVPGAYRLNDVATDGRIAAQMSYSDTGSCSAVLDADAVVQVETCNFTLDEFSTDGALLSGGDSYLDGFGQGYLVVLDPSNLEEVARWEGVQGGAATDSTWEDANHLLINAYEQGEWRIYRLGVDGSVEQVLAGAGDDFSPAFTLLG